MYLRWEVDIRVSECRVDKEMIDGHRDANTRRIHPFCRKKLLVLVEALMEAEVASVQNVADFGLEEDHDSTGAVVSVEEGDGNAFLLIFVEVHPVLFFKFEAHLQKQGGLVAVLAGFSEGLTLRSARCGQRSIISLRVLCEV